MIPLVQLITHSDTTNNECTYDIYIYIYDYIYIYIIYIHILQERKRLRSEAAEVAASGWMRSHTQKCPGCDAQVEHIYIYIYMHT